MVSCPLGAQCNMGTDGGIWKTDNLTNELVKIQIEAHVKYAHQAAAAGAAAATLKAEKLVQPTLQIRDGIIEGGSILFTDGRRTRPRPTSLWPPRITWSLASGMMLRRFCSEDSEPKVGGC